MKSIFFKTFKRNYNLPKFNFKNQLFFQSSSNIPDPKINDMSDESFINSRRFNFSKSLKSNLRKGKVDQLENIKIPSIEIEKKYISDLKQKMTAASYQKILKPYPSILSSIEKLHLLQNKEFMNIIDDLILCHNESSEFQTNPLSTITFKFLLMTAQIISPSVIYTLDLTKTFPDLYDVYKENFLIMFNNKPEALLIYNAFYFCFHNTGHFGNYFEIMDSIFKNESSIQSRLMFVLNSKIKIKNSLDMGKFEINHSYINTSDKSITTPTTELVKDIIFKYEDKLSKVRMVTDDINTKKTVEKAKYILKYFSQIQQFDREFFAKMGNFKHSLEIISSYFLENVKDILNKDVEILFNEVEDINQNFKETIKQFSNLKTPLINIYPDSIYEVYNPLFSGEFRLENQFKNLVNKSVNTKSALNWLKSFIDSQFTDGDIYSLNDFLKVKIVLNDKMTYSDFLSKNCLMSFDYQDLTKINLMDKTNLNIFEERSNVVIRNYIKSNSHFKLDRVNKAFFSSYRKSFTGLSRKYFSNEKTKEYFLNIDDKEREKQTEENFSKYINMAENIEKGIEIKEELNLEKFTIDIKSNQKSLEVSVNSDEKLNKSNKIDPEIDFFNNKSSQINKNFNNTKTFNDDRNISNSKFVQDKKKEENSRSEIRNGVDLSLALMIYNIDWWNKKILFYEEELERKRSFQNILSDPILKDDIPLICYSLTHHKYDLNKSVNNPEMFFYDIFINPLKPKVESEKNSKTIEDTQSIESFIALHPFKFSLGFYGYLSLLKSAESKKSKSGLKKILELMKIHNYLIPAEIYKEVINICINNNFPITLHEIMINFIKQGKLPKDCFIMFSLYIDSFKEYTKEIREINLNVQEYLKIPLDYSIIEPFMVKLISINKKKDAIELLTNFKSNISKNFNLNEMSNLKEDEKTSYLEDTIYKANYKTCLYLLSSINKIQFKKEVYINSNKIDTIIKEIKLNKKKLKSPEFLIINIIYCNYMQDIKNLPQYLILFFEMKNLQIDEFEFEELMDLWLNGLITKDIVAWKKFLQTFDNRNIIYHPKYIDKVLQIYNNFKDNSETKIFLMAYDKEMYKKLTYNHKFELKNKIKSIFDYSTFKEINEQLNNIYYGDRVKKYVRKNIENKNNDESSEKLKKEKIY